LYRRYAAIGHIISQAGGCAALHPRLFKGHRSAISNRRWTVYIICNHHVSPVRRGPPAERRL